MNQSLFLTLLLVVDVALFVALVCWGMIATRSSWKARKAAGFFVVCFALYVFGQSMVILDVLEMPVDSSYSSYLYALAAVLFCVGSVYQLRSTQA